MLEYDRIGIYEGIDVIKPNNYAGVLFAIIISFLK